MTFADVVGRLEQALAAPLPGERAQRRMAPRPRREWPAGFNPARIRHAAGLLLVVPTPVPKPVVSGFSRTNDSRFSPTSDSGVSRTAIEAGAGIVLTRRSDTVGRHSGQVSLPGGVVDPGETFEQAALREAHEEVGLAADGVRILGTLTPLDIPVSGFRLHPVVAALPRRPVLTPSDAEVAAILHVPIAQLTDRRSFAESAGERDGVPLIVPAFHVEDVEIWGATAMVLAEFLTLLGWERPDANMHR